LGALPIPLSINRSIAQLPDSGIKTTDDAEREWDNHDMGKERSRMAQTKEGLPLDLEGLSPEEAARALKRHNPRLRGSEEALAETIRRVRAGVGPLEEDAESIIRRMILETS
jgi:hypothetical protein